MNNRRQLAELLFDIGQLEQEIARRKLSEIAPWLAVLDETDRLLVETHYTLHETDRPAFVQGNERLAYIASVWTKEVRSPADLERLLYPERIAERERKRQEREAQRLAQLELDRVKWAEAYFGSNNVMRQAAKNWFEGHNLPLPDGQPIEPSQAPQLPVPVREPEPEPQAPAEVAQVIKNLDNCQGQLPTNEAQPPKKATVQKAIPFLSFGGSLPAQSDGPICPKCNVAHLRPSRLDAQKQVCPTCDEKVPCSRCGARLRPKRSDPSRLSCYQCGLDEQPGRVFDLDRLGMDPNRIRLF